LAERKYLEEKEYRGRWFLPGKSMQKFPGVLKINTASGKSELKLFVKSNLDGTDISMSHKKQPFLESKILLGVCESSGELITLYNYSNSGSTFVPSRIGQGLFELTFQTSHVFIGAHFPLEEDIKFNDFSFDLEDVHKWFYGLFPLFDFNDTGGYCFNDYSAKEVDLFSNSDYRIVYKAIPSGNIGESLNMKVANVFTIQFKKPSSLERCYGLLEAVLDFFQFSMTKKINLIEENGRVSQDFEIPNSSTKEVSIFSTKEKTENRFVNPSRYYISPKKSTPNRNIVLLSNWLEKYSYFQYPLEIYFWGVQKHWKRGSKAFMSIEYANTLLNVVQAIEAMVKRHFNEEYKVEVNLHENEKTETLESLRSIGVGDDILEFLEKNLLKKPKRIKDIKLNELFRICFKLLKHSINENVDADSFEKFATEISKCRNDIAHVKLASDKELGDKYNLHDLFQVSQIIFLGVLGKIIDMTDDEIKSGLSNLEII
jgi:hypothetical protein